MTKDNPYGKGGYYKNYSTFVASNLIAGKYRQFSYMKSKILKYPKAKFQLWIWNELGLGQMRQYKGKVFLNDLSVTELKNEIRQHK